MPGNSERRGAKRKPGSKKGPTVGSGGQKRRGLAGRGPTPAAQERTKHPAARRGRASEKRAATGDQAAPERGDGGVAGRSGSATSRVGARAGRAGGSASRAGGASGRGGGASGRAGGASGRGGSANRAGGASARSGSSRSKAPRGRAGGVDGPENVAGRNAVVEALRAKVPATALYLAERIDTDDRVREALKLASNQGVPLMEASRTELDRLTGGAVHQGLALQVPSYTYAHPDDLLVRATDAGEPVLLVALDGVTDPRNLGAVVRSAAAFGAHGVVVPARRAAGMTASAWKSSAGAAARVPVARATNLTRTLEAYRDAGVFVVGLDSGGTVEIENVELAADSVVLVIGSEGRGLSRLVREHCDVIASIPIGAATESLNAGVAASIALYEVARHRR